MTKHMRILFPTDFSQAAQHAYVYALQFAKATGASIITLHAYRLPDIRGVHLPNTLQQIYEGISLETFENYKDTVPVLHTIAEQQHATSVPVSHVMEEGDPIRTIIRTAEENAVDLIIMGTTGAGMIKEVFLGSVAAEVMENANVPVLAIPNDAEFKGHIGRMALAAELQEEDEKALPRVLAIAEMFGAKLYCVNADVAHTTQYTHRVEGFRSKFPEVEFHVLESTDIETSVRTFVKQHHIDILAMIIHKRGWLKELFSYSMTKRMSYQTDIPILAIQAHTL
jgi:nucleotide-binding universal stress UspA family protein